MRPLAELDLADALDTYLAATHEFESVNNKVKPLGFFCNSTHVCNHALPSSFPHATNFLSILFSPLLSHLQRHTLLSLPPSRAFTVLSLLFVQSFHYITRALGFCFVCFFIIYSTCRACPRFTKKKNWLDKSNLRAPPGGQGGCL